nr:tyramine oxidase [Phycisphaerae bacterium]NIR49261.1 tyramine oxidase [candidate division KSB1 bacterium]NIV00884.1 tyramine oxidase [Phycisphaerae bacterium]NIV70010.1 tyramine oxidase [Phycisphaerae bacterium]NIW71345.1 tyramine oxidase [candidate division KSB1 bacterium]
IVMQKRAVYEAVVDITGRKVLSRKQVENAQPSLLLSEEWMGIQRIVRSNREWQKAIRRRGITSLGDVVCIPNTVGYFGDAYKKNRRLVKVASYESAGSRNFWSRPIEGLTVLVDLGEWRVIEVLDIGVIPIPQTRADLDTGSVEELRKAPPTVSMTQPEGPGFTVDGRVVQWQKWRFHFRMDPRPGLVISTVCYEDDGNLRQILYQGSLSELFVPYMDPDSGWYYKTFLDAGEYGIGKLATSLEAGIDCPANAQFFDATFADDWGTPYTIERAACLYERYYGDVAWRHYESETGHKESRKRTELVLRSVSAIGNYDYIFDWIFRQDGSIKIAVGASGIDLVKGVHSRTIADESAEEETRYGRMVAEQTLAVNHDHFFCYRLDPDIDGMQNSFLYERLKTRRTADKSLRKSVWIVDSQVLSSEQAARLRINLEKPALWRVINPNVKGSLGYPVSFQLKPKANAVSLLTADDPPQRRAGFTDYHLWVTPFRQKERYAAGLYPNQSKGGDGLPHWASADRSIKNTDIVLWYTLGFHHVVRAEDWPVLPTNWHEFELRPFDFFPKNPALDLPE